MRARYGISVVFFLTAFASNLAAQAISVGVFRPDGVAVDAPEVSTVIDVEYGATGDGRLNTATFVWSEAPCPAAVKIKFFRPDGTRLKYLEERGPYDVVPANPRRRVQNVVLNPPVSVRRGDLIGITSLTSCGRPTLHEGGTIFIVPGDGRQDVTPPAALPRLGQVEVTASNTALNLLNGRFLITSFAQIPRIGAREIGWPVPVNDRFGYFSLPGFTGDPAFPEIVVKMADATGLPGPLGGNFWLFYSSLTDTRYFLTVTDTRTQVTRDYLYYDVPPEGFPFCGGADTTTFH